MVGSQLTPAVSGPDGKVLFNMRSKLLSWTRTFICEAGDEGSTQYFHIQRRFSCTCTASPLTRSTAEARCPHDFHSRRRAVPPSRWQPRGIQGRGHRRQRQCCRRHVLGVLEEGAGHEEPPVCEGRLSSLTKVLLQRCAGRGPGRYFCAVSRLGPVQGGRQAPRRGVLMVQIRRVV